MSRPQVAKPEEVTTLVSAAIATGADFVACGNSYLDGPAVVGPGTKPAGMWLPLGGATTVGLFRDG